MRVKRYVADSIHEAILQVKSDLGREALILHTKTFKVGGIFGLFARKRFEVIAALDENNGRNTEPPTEASAENGEVTASSPSPASAAQEKTGEIQAIHDEMVKLRAAIQEMAASLARREGVSAEITERRNFPAVSISSGLETDEISLGEYGDPLIGGPIALTGRPTVVALIGPTGVGKTTTIAKIAAHFVLFERIKVALVTIDTYRIAAVEQLKTYAEIINIPVSVVYTKEDYREALHNLAGYDLILVDTAGRSQKNSNQIQELQSFFSERAPDEVHLVISATTKFQDMVDVLDSFSSVGYNRIIFSKLDETNEYQSLLALAGRIRVPLSYVTTGQNVPDDIEVVTADRLAVLAHKEYSHA